MNIDDLILVSVDDHVVEPPDMFEQHIPRKYRERAPRVVHKKDGSDVWLFEGRQVPNIGLNAVAGRPPEEYGMEPTAYTQLRPGCYDLAARVDDMNVNGVLGSLCFPSFPSFCGHLFLASEDKGLAHAVLQAYNDWHIEEWCGGAPGRFIPLAITPLWDPKLMAEEVRRVARKGCHAISFSENPEKIGLPSLQQPHWDPFWQACQDEGAVVCLHFGTGQQMVYPTLDAPMDAVITLMPMAMASCAADLLWSPVLRKYPKLEIALSEASIGWVPYFLERADYVYETHHLWTHQDFADKRPSEVFREHMILCFIVDPVGVRNRHAVGVETISWECDFPHSDSTWPRSPERLMESLEGVPDDEIRAMTYQNALRRFRYEPFQHIPKQQATVGALRAQAAGVDTTPRSQGGLAPGESGGIVTTGQVVKQLATAIMNLE